MSHEREPIKQTCPQIDKFIRDAKYYMTTTRHIKEMSYDDLVDLAIYMNEQLGNCIDNFEEIRKSNETLRSWGCEEAENYDNLYEEYRELESKLII